MCVESKKIIQINLFPGRNRDTDVENRHVNTVGEGEGGMNKE